jgi:hypothetical protein
MEVIQFKTRVGDDGILQMNIGTSFANHEVEVVVVMQPLRALDLRCENMLIEDLNASESCIEGLKRAGFTTVGELTEFLEHTWGGRAGTPNFHPGFLKHQDETVSKLK